MRCNWDEVANMTGVSVTPVGTYVHIVQGFCQDSHIFVCFALWSCYCVITTLICHPRGGEGGVRARVLFRNFSGYVLSHNGLTEIGRAHV